MRLVTAIPLVLLLVQQQLSSTHAAHVSVCRDATFDVPATRGTVCSGAGDAPLAAACPIKGEAAAHDCNPGLPSYDPVTKQCVAKEDAVCAVVFGSTWGCVFPSIGCMEHAAVDAPKTECPTWDFHEDADFVSSSTAGGRMLAAAVLDDIDTAVDESWFVQNGPISELYACNRKPTPAPTTMAPTPPPTTEAPKPTPAPTTMAPTPTPTPAPTTMAPTPTPTPCPTTMAPTPTPTPCPTTMAPTPTPTPCPTTMAPTPTPTPCPTTMAPTPAPTTVLPTQVSSVSEYAGQAPIATPAAPTSAPAYAVTFSAAAEGGNADTSSALVDPVVITAIAAVAVVAAVVAVARSRRQSSESRMLMTIEAIHTPV